MTVTISASRVDLRAGGGARRKLRAIVFPSGRSPRGRRSRARRRQGPTDTGSISARAEEPTPGPNSAQRPMVDLRAGGGAASRTSSFFHPSGRSPRGRRSLSYLPVDDAAHGSISARAEEPLSSLWRRAEVRVDLRAGGGAQLETVTGAFRKGRSPRGRRSQGMMLRVLVLAGSISARAEEPRRRPGGSRKSRVDLRAGGGAPRNGRSVTMRQGRSPRGRRSRAAGHCEVARRGSISARAEEPSWPPRA